VKSAGDPSGCSNNSTATKYVPLLSGATPAAALAPDLAAPDAEEYRWLNEWDGEESPAEEVQRQADSGDPGSTEG